MNNTKETINPDEIIFISDDEKLIITNADTSCFDCDECETCEYAFDPNNIDEDCMAINRDSQIN